MHHVGWLNQFMSVRRNLMNDVNLEQDELLKLRKTARQVLFRPKVEGIPVSLGGTFFLLKYEGHFFAITAKHVVGDATNDQLLLTTTDRSFIPARILQRFDVCDNTVTVPAVTVPGRGFVVF